MGYTIKYVAEKHTLAQIPFGIMKRKGCCPTSSGQKAESGIIRMGTWSGWD